MHDPSRASLELLEIAPRRGWHAVFMRQRHETSAKPLEVLVVDPRPSHRRKRDNGREVRHCSGDLAEWKMAMTFDQLDRRFSLEAWEHQRQPRTPR
jgi:hypothetical protein